ncbi:uncharacterized protein [Rutidosis leptorrhynchoides]|uniref:uncharacterized protein n=1 Tax=Rutidosis leptorrhynchoides TaxID=125765 RepID=UPI003A990DE7
MSYMKKAETNEALLKQENELIKQQMRNQQASIQNLERDLGRVANLLSERPPVWRFIEKIRKAPVPYPKALRKDKIASQYEKFSNMINKITVNMPLFIKDPISSKGKYEEVSATFLVEECSTVLQKHRLPPKLGDPGRFIIPCSVGDSDVYDALADLGASGNLMPYSLYLKLGLGDHKPTRMEIKLAKQTFDTPMGIAEDILLKVETLVFLVDFVVLDMKEDTQVPIILGRPFLNTANTLIMV